jgi:hypothetical protein
MKTSPLKLLQRPSAVVLSAGHGAGDPGAVEGSHREAEQCIDIVNSMAAHLAMFKVPCVVVPHSLGLGGGIKWINERYGFGDVVAFEIHRDSAETVRGKPDADFRCGIYTGVSTESKAVGYFICDAMKAIGAHSTSWSRKHIQSPRGRLAFVSQPKPARFILELGFMQGLNSAEHLNGLAYLGARAILRALGQG